MATKVSFLTKSKPQSPCNDNNDDVRTLWRSEDGLTQCIEENGSFYLVRRISMEDIANKLFTLAADDVRLLSAKELGIYEMLVKGMQHKEIAARANISARTVKFHAANIYRKLNVHDRSQLMWKYRSRAAVPNEIQASL
jgi:DNA-binding NarL/FixJ family response regulator